MRRLLALAVIGAAALIAALAASAGDGIPNGNGSANVLTVAVIGDTPYGAAQLAGFPALVDSINEDPKVRLALHLGDVKNGSSVCTDAYFAQIRSLFDTFKDPLVYTPGDNEWTDCHRPAAGGYLPTERLDAVRSAFFPKPGVTLGGRKQQVLTQADVPGYAPFVENELWLESRVAFATVHVVGSNNDLAPWFGSSETPAQKEARLAEYESRLTADLRWIEWTFELARAADARGVVLAMQADMWDGSPLNGFDAIVQEIAEGAAAFGRPVLLLEGDSHRFTVDNPLAAGSPSHGVTTAAPNLTRIVVEGETASEWLRLTIDPRSSRVFTFERVRL